MMTSTLPLCLALIGLFHFASSLRTTPILPPASFPSRSPPSSSSSSSRSSSSSQSSMSARSSGTSRSSASVAIRETSAGRVMGSRVSHIGLEAEAFYGIPYAAPPIGPLRFERPIRADNWTGVKDCREEAPYCIQFWYDRHHSTRTQSEDCLTLNVFLPTRRKVGPARAPFPVLVWLHGGSFQVNGANTLPLNGTLDNFVSQGLVVVTINYRLGPLGFLSTLNSELPGNYGLEDQIQALQWVQENIASFQGDANRVTLGGESAGAASASLLAASPRAQGLFHRAMLRSGSGLAPWAVRSSNTDLNSLLLIRWHDCGEHVADDMAAVKRCLQKVPWESLVDSWKVLGQQDLMYVVSARSQSTKNYNHPFLAHTYFTPVVDSFRGVDAILPTYPSKMIPQYAHVPVMLGVTTAECAAYITWLYYLVSRGSAKVDLEDLDFVVPDVSYANPRQVRQAVSHYYIWHQYSVSKFSFGQALVKIASDQNFVTPAAFEANIYASKGLSVHAYIYDHPLQGFEDNLAKYGLYDVGSANGYDMVLLGGTTEPVETPGEAYANGSRADQFVADLLSHTIANFVANGDPEVTEMPGLWPRFTSQCGRALRVSPSPSLDTFFPGVQHFWRETIPLIEKRQEGSYGLGSSQLSKEPMLSSSIIESGLLLAG